MDGGLSRRRETSRCGVDGIRLTSRRHASVRQCHHRPPCWPSSNKEDDMGKGHKDSAHHETAAEHHEEAAKHHREAAKHYEDNDHHKAGHHAHLAHAHGLHATHHGHEAAKHHAEHHA